MNTNDRYERRLDPAAESGHVADAPTAEISPLAIHGDPSQAPAASATKSGGDSRSVQWVRPSELPAMVGARYVRRGIDAQSALTRRARRVPARATSRARVRISRTAIAHSDALTPREGGIGL